MSHPPCDRLVVAFELNRRPHPKGRPRFGKTHAYTDPRTREYEAEVKAACVKAMKGRAPFDGPVELACLFEIKGARAGDWDNYAKAVGDAINGIAYLDDRQVVHARIGKSIRADVDRVSVAVVAVTA